MANALRVRLKGCPAGPAHHPAHAAGIQQGMWRPAAPAGSAPRVGVWLIQQPQPLYYDRPPD